MEELRKEAGTTSLEDRLNAAFSAEKISHDFYAQASVKTSLISGTHAFQDMMEREEKHVRMLAEVFEKFLGRPPNDPKRSTQGGLALPGDSVDAEIAVEIAIEEEEKSIQMYRAFQAQVQEEEEQRLYEALLSDEREHIRMWKEFLKGMPGPQDAPRRSREVFRFTPEDIQMIGKALSIEKGACKFYRKGMEQAFLVDAQHAFQFMAMDEENHVRILEDEYRRLTGEVPEVKVPRSRLPWKDLEKDDDCLSALEFAMKEEKQSLVSYLHFEGRCTNSALRRAFWDLIEDEWKHLTEWRKAIKDIRQDRHSPASG